MYLTHHINVHILSPMGPWLQKPNTKRELRQAFFASKFSLKIRQTRVAINPNAIFTKNGPKSRHRLDSRAISATITADR